MAYERPFKPGQKLEISPAEAPFVGAGGKKIPFVWVISDDGRRMIVESAIEGLPFFRAALISCDKGDAALPATIVIVLPKDPSVKTKFTFRQLDECRAV